ncbi:MAG: calycin-like domain-containing protein [Bacteroides sp.]|nr:calycin-like domain-containing protein [Bacteroides sp.]
MRKKIFVFATMIAMGLRLVSCPSYNVFIEMEQPVAEVVSFLSAADVAGSYVGTLDKVVMNGASKNPLENVTAKVTANSDGTFNLQITAFQVGKMPGSIAVDAKNIKLNADNSFRQDVDKAVIFTMLEISTSYKATGVTGKFTPTADGYTFSFALDTVGTVLGIDAVNASIHFTGKMKK